MRIASGSAVARPVTRTTTTPCMRSARTASMQPVRPHTASARTPRPYLVVEQCSGCGLSGWGMGGQRLRRIRPAALFRIGGHSSPFGGVQAREDGVISPVTYLNTRPGLARNDATILPEQTGLAPSSGNVVLHVAGQATTVGAWQRVDEDVGGGKGTAGQSQSRRSQAAVAPGGAVGLLRGLVQRASGTSLSSVAPRTCTGRLVQQRFRVRAVLRQRRR